MSIWIIATITAFFVRGLCGFASTMIFTSILGFSINNIDISPVELALGFPANIVLTWKYRKGLVRKIYMPLLLMVVGGSIPGVFLLKNTDVRYVKVLFGFFIIAISIELLLREYGKYILKDTKPVMTVLGILSGIMCGLFGIGALVAAYASRVTHSDEEFKANISVVFLVESIIRLSLFAYLGILTPQSLKTVLMLAPLMLISLLAGIRCSRVINEKTIKKMVIILLILSGIMLIIKNI